MSEGRHQSISMKTELLLDYETILANLARTVHVAVAVQIAPSGLARNYYRRTA